MQNGKILRLYEFQGERNALRRWAEARSGEDLREYWETHNRTSIDGLPTYILQNR